EASRVRGAHTSNTLCQPSPRPSPRRRGEGDRRMRTSHFDFDLPPDRIALRPVSPRDAAKMLVVRPGIGSELEDKSVRDLPELLAPGDALVINDTRVIPARLEGERTRHGSTAHIEATLIRRES